MTRRFINTTLLRVAARGCVIICLFCALNQTDLFGESHAPTSTAVLTDFVSFWASARLLIDGGNPYSPAEVLKLQRGVGFRDTKPLLIWHPPWTLSFLVPFGAMDFQFSQFCWLLINVLSILLSAQKLWAIYGLSVANAYWPWLTAFTLLPTWMVLLIGQMSPLILLGIAGFLHFDRKNQLYMAGASTVLISLKPHLFYLFWLGLIFWIWKERRWRVGIGAMVAGLIVAIIPAIFDPSIYREFLDVYKSSGQSTPFELPAPSPGSFLSRYLPYGNLPIQFLPPALATLWFLWHWQNHKANWNWTEQVPMLLLVSLTLSAYAWTYDQVILLPAVIHGLALVKRQYSPWYKSAVVLIYGGINACYLVAKLLVTKDSYYFWLAPAFLLTYFGLRVVSSNSAAAAPEGVT